MLTISIAEIGPEGQYGQAGNIRETPGVCWLVEIRCSTSRSIDMAPAEVGTDGAYRMKIENRYKQLAGVRRDSKLLSVLGVSCIV